MEQQKIFEKIAGQFGEAVEVCPATGDAFVLVRQADRLRDVCGFVKDEPELRFDFPACLCGVDDGTSMWVVYHLFSVALKHTLVLKVKIDRVSPSVASVVDIWPGMGWHERETFDMYGIRFEGHPNLRRILLPDDWEGYPLRKDYKYPDMYRDIPLT